MTREDELEIVKSVQSGNSSDFEKLVLENQTNVYNLALRMVGDRDDAFDMSQDAFIKAYASIGSFRGESRFSVWLYRLTTNVCLDFLRSRERKSHISLTYLDEDGDDDKDIEIPDERFAPDSELEKKELRTAVQRGLLKLPKEYRAILLLREIDGLSYDEISEALSLEAGTVKSRIFRARKKLCSILCEDGNFSRPSASNKQTLTKEV